MKITPTKIRDCYTVKTQKYEDYRGFLQEIYSEDWVDSKIQAKWNHIVCSTSTRGVIRGIHWAPYNKFVSCVTGSLFDVIVDLRPDSPTYLEWEGIWLSGHLAMKVFIPKGCGHGFFAAEEPTVMVYLKDQTYQPGVEKDWHYQSFGIEWPEAEIRKPPGGYILSAKDENAPPYIPIEKKPNI